MKKNIIRVWDTLKSVVKYPDTGVVVVEVVTVVVIGNSCGRYCDITPRACGS